MGLKCDALNMCDDREELLNSGRNFAKTPNFCPYCGGKWFESAINESAAQHAQSDAKLCCTKEPPGCVLRHFGECNNGCGYYKKEE